MLLEAEGREMHSRSEHFGLGQDADSTDTIDLHLHIWITVGVAEVGKMRSPRRVLGVAFDNDGVLVKGVRKRKSCIRFLP